MLQDTSEVVKWLSTRKLLAAELVTSTQRIMAPAVADRARTTINPPMTMTPAAHRMWERPGLQRNPAAGCAISNAKIARRHENSSAGNHLPHAGGSGPPDGRTPRVPHPELPYRKRRDVANGATGV